MSSVGEFIYLITILASFKFCCVLTTYFSGQWAPILGAVIGALGSWYTSSSELSTATLLPVHRPHDFNGKATFEHIEHYPGDPPTLNPAELSHPEPIPRPDRHSSPSTHPSTSEAPKILSHRTRVNMIVRRLGVWMMPAPERFVDDMRLTTGHDRYREYPHTPGEEWRNPHLQEHDRLHRLSVQSFYARSSPPRSPTVGIGEPGPSRHSATPSTPTGDYRTTPLQRQHSPPHRQLTSPSDSDDMSPPAESVSPVTIVVTTPDVEDLA